MTKLSDRLEGKTLTFRDGSLVVKIKPLGNIVTETIRDKVLDYSDADGARIRVNIGLQSLHIVAFGIEEASLDGAKWPMESVKILNRQFMQLRMACLDDFTRQEFNTIAEEIANLSELDETEKNCSESPSD